MILWYNVMTIFICKSNVTKWDIVGHQMYFAAEEKMNVSVCTSVLTGGDKVTRGGFSWHVSWWIKMQESR